MQKQEWKTNLRALVAGGAGFVGSHLCRRLLQSGYGEVICVDNLQTGRIANVADLLCSPHFRFFEHDIVNGLPVSGALHEIYHLPVRLLLCNIKNPRYIRSRLPSLAASIFWNWPKRKGQESCLLPPAKCMVMRRSRPKTNHIGAM